jgi:hypothetical protein
MIPDNEQVVSSIADKPEPANSTVLPTRAEDGLNVRDAATPLTVLTVNGYDTESPVGVSPVGVFPVA